MISLPSQELFDEGRRLVAIHNKENVVIFTSRNSGVTLQSVHKRIKEGWRIIAMSDGSDENYRALMVNMVPAEFSVI